MKLNLAHPAKRARIEIIPLIDVIFFLLATFVLVSLTMSQVPGVWVRLPEAATAVPHDLVETITLTITDRGAIYWEKEFTTFDQFLLKLIKYKRDKGDPRILINANNKASFGQTVTILDEIRKIGIDKVSIETRLKQVH